MTSRVVLLLILAGAALTARAEAPLQFNRETPVVAVYRRAHAAVVNISGERTVTRQLWPGFDWPDAFDLRGPLFERQVAVLGSGFVLHEDGFIVTNAHVTQGVSRLKVVFSDGREFQARIVSADATKDLAVLAIEAEGKLPYIELGHSSDLMVGETVIAIGNPYGYSNTVTSGIVSAVGRDIQVTEGYWLRGLIQTDAPINPGNSGGPLLNINGRLIGITTAIRAEAQNIGFAIPVDTLLDNLSQMLMPEKLPRVRLRLTMGHMTTAGAFRGLIVDAVSKGSPADEKGLAAGDLILEMDGYASVAMPPGKRGPASLAHLPWSEGPPCGRVIGRLETARICPALFRTVAPPALRLTRHKAVTCSRGTGPIILLIFFGFSA